MPGEGERMANPLLSCSKAADRTRSREMRILGFFFLFSFFCVLSGEKESDMEREIPP